MKRTKPHGKEDAPPAGKISDIPSAVRKVKKTKNPLVKTFEATHYQFTLKPNYDVLLGDDSKTYKGETEAEAPAADAEPKERSAKKKANRKAWKAHKKAKKKAFKAAKKAKEDAAQAAAQHVDSSDSGSENEDDEIPTCPCTCIIV